MRKMFFAAVFLVLSTLAHAEKMSVALNPGEAFRNRAPQIAVWVEDEKGNFAGTVFVTKKASANRWIMAPEEGRPESLPDWYRAKGQNPADRIGKDDLDATTGATPKKGIVASKEMSLEKGRLYVVKCQVNQSFDYNGTYTKKNSGVDGQPAVLYEGSFVCAGESQEIELKYVGRHEGITSAKDILGKIYAVIE